MSDPILDELQQLGEQGKKQRRAAFMMDYVLASRRGGLGFYKDGYKRDAEVEQMVKDAGVIYDKILENCEIGKEEVKDDE